MYSNEGDKEHGFCSPGEKFKSWFDGEKMEDGTEEREGPRDEVGQSGWWCEEEEDLDGGEDCYNDDCENVEKEVSWDGSGSEDGRRRGGGGQELLTRTHW